MKAPVETCEQCGFDASEWDRQDTINTFPHLADMAGLAISGAADDIVNTRPNPETWSVAEYVDHMREVVFGNRFMIELAHGQSGIDLGQPPPPGTETADVQLDAALEGLRSEAKQLFDFVRKLEDGDWSRFAVLEGREKDIDWVSRHVVHDCFHHYADIAAIRHQLGDTVQMQGAVAQLSASGGGVPKQAVDTATITRRGMDGDTQAARRHHGRPWQALCLYSTDVIAALQAEGHPIHAGASGENITVSGIDWASLRSGLTVSIGEVVCRLTSPAIPCSKNNQWFADGASSRMDHAKHPGWSRWYAEVRTPGTIAAGDEVTVSSAGA